MKNFQPNSNLKPVKEWNLYKHLDKGDMVKASEASIELINQYPGNPPLKSVLVYIREAMKAKTGSMKKIFINKAIQTLETNYK